MPPGFLQKRQISKPAGTLLVGLRKVVEGVGLKVD